MSLGALTAVVHWCQKTATSTSVHAQATIVPVSVEFIVYSRTCIYPDPNTECCNKNNPFDFWFTASVNVDRFSRFVLTFPRKLPM